MTRAYWPDRPKIARPLKVVEYILIVIWDILVANVQVAAIILFRRNENIRSAFITVPIEVTSPEAITILAGTITMTPGFVRTAAPSSSTRSIPTIRTASGTASRSATNGD